VAALGYLLSISHKINIPFPFLPSFLSIGLKHTNIGQIIENVYVHLGDEISRKQNKRIKKRTRDVVKCLPSKHEALRSSLSIAKNKKKIMKNSVWISNNSFIKVILRMLYCQSSLAAGSVSAYSTNCRSKTFLKKLCPHPCLLRHYSQ
jgi:hypothetical protein